LNPSTPGRVIEGLREKDACGVERLDRLAGEMADLTEQIQTILLDPLQVVDRAGLFGCCGSAPGSTRGAAVETADIPPLSA
jgi:hypothetical protein